MQFEPEGSLKMVTGDMPHDKCKLPFIAGCFYEYLDSGSNAVYTHSSVKGGHSACLDYEVNYSSCISESLVAGFFDHVGGRWLRGFAPASKLLSLSVSGNTQADHD